MGTPIIVVGASLGGLNALYVLLDGLPADFPSPIAIVQHRGKEPEETLSTLLAGQCALPVLEPVDKEPLRPGQVYIAPAEYHLLVDRDALSLSTEGRINSARPSVDALFESAAAAYGPDVIAVVLTGASRDGANGVVAVKQQGGLVVVQDPQSAESRIMPEAAIAATAVDRVLPLADISAFLVDLCGGKSCGRS